MLRIQQSSTETLDDAVDVLIENDDFSLEQDLLNADTMQEKMQAYFQNANHLVKGAIATRANGTRMFKYIAHQDDTITDRLGIDTDAPTITLDDTRIDTRTMYKGNMFQGTSIMYRDSDNTTKHDLAIPWHQATKPEHYKENAAQTNFFNEEIGGTASFLDFGWVKDEIENVGGRKKVSQDGWQRLERAIDDSMYGFKSNGGPNL